MIAAIGAAGVAFLLALALLRLHAGPTLHDRAAAAISAMTKAALICAALGAAARRPDIVDAGLILALSTFVLSVAVMKFFRAGTMQAPMIRSTEGE